jgi:hypothetical protein
LNPDRLAKSRRRPAFDVVTDKDKKVLSDGNRTLELHVIKDSPHNSGILMAFLPKEKILIEVDVYTPGNPAPANSPSRGSVPINSSTANLVDNVEKLKLDFEKILPLHGTGAVTRADLYAAVGQTSSGHRDRPGGEDSSCASAKPGEGFARYHVHDVSQLEPRTTQAFKSDRLASRRG